MSKAKTVALGEIARDSVRAYFAPLTGAYKAVREEMRHAERRTDKHPAAKHATRRHSK